MKKILFNDKFALTQAVLDGRKTQTRRIVSERLWDRWTEYDDYCNSVGVSGLSEMGVSVTREYYGCEKFFLDNSPYKVGEVVAVAQSYKDAGIEFVPIRQSVLAGKKSDARQWGWTKHMTGYNNKMFTVAALMPHRIRITDVRVERLNDISKSDIKAEGLDYVYGYSESYFFGFGVKTEKEWIRLGNRHREAYAALIDRILGKGTFESNPWVFAYTFELVK